MLLESMLYAITAWFLISPLTLALLYSRLKPTLIIRNSGSFRPIFFM